MEPTTLTDEYEYNPLPDVAEDKRCIVPGCPYPRLTAGLCVHHYKAPMTQNWIDRHAEPGGPVYGVRQLREEISAA